MLQTRLLQNHQKFARARGQNIEIAPVIEEHGGRILVRGGHYEVVEGTKKFKRHAVIEFPSIEAVLSCYHSKGYQDARQFRLGGVGENELVIVEGVAG